MIGTLALRLDSCGREIGFGVVPATSLAAKPVSECCMSCQTRPVAGLERANEFKLRVLSPLARFGLFPSGYMGVFSGCDYSETRFIASTPVKTAPKPVLLPEGVCFSW